MPIFDLECICGFHVDGILERNLPTECPVCAESFDHDGQENF